MTDCTDILKYSCNLLFVSFKVYTFAIILLYFRKSEEMDKIDKLDKKILAILSTNARIPFKDVAAPTSDLI